MKKAIKTHFILSLVFFVCMPAHACSSEHWANFLKQPDKKALVVLEKSIAAKAQRCSWGNTDNATVAPTGKQELQLFHLVSKGNQIALHAALLVSKCWDGSDLEDFYRSTGIFFEHQPLVFLTIVKEKAITDSEIKHMLTMLPLDTVDDFDLKISVVENRIKFLKKIGDESLNEIKIKGLSFLEKEKDDLYRIQSERK